MTPRLSGLIAAVFTPMNSDCSLNLQAVQPMVDFLINDGISGFYVCGSTGEGPLLTFQERMQVAQTYVDATHGRIPVIVHVGHDSIRQAAELAAHAQQIGADAIAAIPPTYFGVASEQVLVACLAEIAAAAPELPFYYYHVPRLTGVDFDLLTFLQLAEKRIPTLAGIKYTAPSVHEFQSLLRFRGGQYTILYGTDEMLSSALSVGAYGAIGTTYNFAAPLYRRIIAAHERGDAHAVEAEQYRSVEMIRLLYRYRGVPAFKAVMSLLGHDCGPTRLPLQTLTPGEIDNMKRELTEIGFFDWSRGGEK